VCVCVRVRVSARRCAADRRRLTSRQQQHTACASGCCGAAGRGRAHTLDAPGCGPGGVPVSAWICARRSRPAMSAVTE
jgi:hypothetical protein